MHFSSATGDWSTPQGLFDVLDNEFGFKLDVCASPSNSKCDRYLTEADDGLAQPWRGVCWMNPPCGSQISHWVKKAHDSAASDRAVVVSLVPARTDTRWWWDHCIHAEVRFLRQPDRSGSIQPVLRKRRPSSWFRVCIEASL